MTTAIAAIIADTALCIPISSEWTDMLFILPSSVRIASQLNLRSSSSFLIAAEKFCFTMRAVSFAAFTAIWVSSADMGLFPTFSVFFLDILSFHPICVWKIRGLFCISPTFAEAFSLFVFSVPAWPMMGWFSPLISVLFSSRISCPRSVCIGFSCAENGASLIRSVLYPFLCFWKVPVQALHSPWNVP